MGIKEVFNVKVEHYDNFSVSAKHKECNDMLARYLLSC